MGRYGQMRTALASHGFALFALVLFAAATALGIAAGQRWADRLAPTREPLLAAAPLGGVGGAGGAETAAPAHEPPTAHPEWPVITTAERDGIRVELRLPTDTYLGGEVLEAEVVVRNVGRTTIALHETYLTLRDEQGRDVELGPAFPAANWLNAMSRKTVKQDVAPGASLRNTHWYRVPPEAAYGYHRYSAWAMAFFWHEKQRPDDLTETGTVQGPEAGPLPLTITHPRYGQRLRAKFLADRQGWGLRVTDSEGRLPSGPFWGEVTERSRSVQSGARALGPSADGTWSAPWSEALRQDGPPFGLRVWVGAPGYVSAVATLELATPPSGEPCPPDRGTSIYSCAEPWRVSWRDGSAGAQGFRVELDYSDGGEQFQYIVPADVTTFAFPAEVLVTQATCHRRKDSNLGVFALGPAGERLLGSRRDRKSVV
jgi:hypothetical protein